MEGSALSRQLQELSPEQLRALLSASGHEQLLRKEEVDAEEDKKPAQGGAQHAADAKDEGNAFFRRGLMKEAVAAYSRCIALDPSNAVCLSNRAAAYLKLKEFDLAVSDCSKTIELAPTIKPFMRRAAACIALMKYRQAVDDLVEALKFEPRNKECHVKLHTIVEIAIDGQRQEGEPENAELRRAGARAAALLSVREGWSKSAVRGNPGPAAVNGHTLFQGANERIYLFGGRAVREQKPDLFVLDENDDSSWDIVPARGVDLPSSRAWHSVAAIGDKGSECYCMYGGVSSRGEDPRVHLLVPVSPRGFRWVLPHCPQDAKEIPAARSGHAAVSVPQDSGDRAVFIFGGRTKRGVSDQLLILRCTSAPSSEDDGAIAWDDVHPPGRESVVKAHLSWPTARDGHSMCLLPRTNTQPLRLVVFGGNGQLNDEKMNDVWLFDLDKQLWTPLQCSGDIPSPRSYHTAHAIDNFLFVVGGRTSEAEDDSVYLLDLGTAEWFKLPIPSDRALTPRAWHSSVLTKAGKLFVLGGGTYHGPLKDAATLDLSTFQSNAALLNHASRQHDELE